MEKNTIDKIQQTIDIVYNELKDHYSAVDTLRIYEFVEKLINYLSLYNI